MKLIPAVFLSSLLIFSGNALADEDENELLYQSMRFSKVDTDFDNLGSAIALGGSLGISIPALGVLPARVLAVELDTDFTVIPGDNSGAGGGLTGGGGGGGGTTCDPVSQLAGLCTPSDGGGSGGSTANNTRTNDEFQMFSLAFLVALRTPTKLYGVARYGVRYWNTNIPELDETRSGNVWSLGVGYRYKEDGLVELTFNDLDEGVKYLTLGVSY